MAKAKDAFRTISEVAEWLDTPTHVLRFWESKFSQIRPVKGAGGRRYYRPADMDLLGGIKKLLHEDGLTIKGTQKLLREQGVKHVASLGRSMTIVSEPAPKAAIPVPVPTPQPEPQLAPIQDTLPLEVSAPSTPQFDFPAPPQSLPYVPARLIGCAPADPSGLLSRAAQITPLLARLQTLHDRVAG